MPLAMDSQGGGTEAEGAKSTMYCSHCYKDGKFIMPDLSAGQMQDRVRGRLEELHMPVDIITSAVDEIPYLRRWAR
jgi:hypothetical protein